MPFGNAASPAFPALLCKAAKNGMSGTPSKPYFPRGKMRTAVCREDAYQCLP